MAKKSWILLLVFGLFSCTLYISAQEEPQEDATEQTEPDTQEQPENEATTPSDQGEQEESTDTQKSESSQEETAISEPEAQEEEPKTAEVQEADETTSEQTDSDDEKKEEDTESQESVKAETAEEETDSDAQQPDEKEEKAETQEAEKPEQSKWKEDGEKKEEEEDDQNEEKTDKDDDSSQEKKNDEDEILGFDTIELDEPQGNWLYKRVWWERAEAKFEKIHSTVGKILEMRTSFFAKRADLDKNVLDPFYLKVGTDRGELLEKVNELLSRIKEHEKRGVTQEEDEDNESMIDKLTREKSEIEGIQKEIEKVLELDESIEDAIMKLVEQINRLRNYDQQAWKDFKTIARVLDDKKARELYYQVDGAWRNVQNLQNYIQNAFTKGFDELVQEVKKEIDRINGSIQELKVKGIDLKKEFMQKNEDQAIENEQEKEAEEQAPQGFLNRYLINPFMAVIGTIGTGLKTLWNVIVDIVMWPIRKIFGTTPPAEHEQPEETKPGVKEIAQEVVTPAPEEKEESKTDTPDAEKAPTAPSTTTPAKPEEAKSVPAEPKADDDDAAAVVDDKDEDESDTQDKQESNASETLSEQKTDSPADQEEKDEDDKAEADEEIEVVERESGSDEDNSDDEPMTDELADLDLDELDEDE